MNPRHLREVLHRAIARYLTVSHDGLHLGAQVVPSTQARILAWGPARTLYRDKKPTCRSLDGATSITHDGRRCEECAFRGRCTAQIRLDLVIDGQAYRILLAFTSASNFLVYAADLRSRNVVIEDVDHQLDVLDRGRFGELRFSCPSRSKMQNQDERESS